MWIVGAAVAVLALAALAGACGDDNGDEAEPTEPLAPTATEAVEPTEPEATEPSATEPANGAATSIDVSLSEFAIDLSEDTGTDGITFNVSNDGAILHNFKVIQTDLEPGDLPVSGGMVDEGQVDIVAQTEGDLAAGESAEVTADLEPGSYVLICNVAGHYEAGMFAGFTVE
jgi:uncharacterized cupredoxin-like copper-binding protein